MDRLPLSVAIIAYNEEDIIGRTLESVKDIAAEIVVVDSHSTDKTKEIAESYGAKVYVEDWNGYAGQKNSALNKCTHEWILFLDADEVVSEELKISIRKELKNPKADGYLVNRRTYYMGKLLKYAWQPEWRLFLVRRQAKPKWIGEPHAKLHINSKNVSRLNGDLLHFSYRNMQHHISKAIDSAKKVAIEKYNNGANVRLFDVILRPLWAFLKVYLLQRGFLDGYPGFIAGVMSFVYTFFKYSFLYELQLKEKLGKELWKR